MENNLPIIALFVVPTIAIIIGLTYFLFPLSESTKAIILILLFSSLIFLGMGFFTKTQWRHPFRMSGWMLFAFYWSTQVSTLYWSEGGDIVNATFAVVGIYFLFYLVYQEWLSIKRKEGLGCLDWITGTTFVTGFSYFFMEKIPIIKDWLVETVASQSCWLLGVFGHSTTQYGAEIYYENNPWPITIIFACTAIQSMLIFVGAIYAVNGVNFKRKIYAFLVTVPVVYALNLIRLAGIVYLVGNNKTSLWTAHNLIGKFGSLIVLIILAFAVFHILPELYDDIVGLLNLPKRNGPVEKFFSNLKK